MPRLVIYREGEASRVFELAGNRPLSIGSEIQHTDTDNPSISRLHAVVRISPTDSGKLSTAAALTELK